MDKRQLVDGCKRGANLIQDGGVLLFFIIFANQINRLLSLC